MGLLPLLVLVLMVCVSVIDSQDSCNPNPCLNGGTCTMSPEHALQCTCTNHYSGYYCTVGRCGENGVCMYERLRLHVPQRNERCDEIYGYLCVCKNGYDGDGFNCTRSVRCGENAVCIYGAFGLYVSSMNERCDEKSGYYCACDYDYEGDGFNCTKKTNKSPK
ncbi:protein crumbs-like [Lingula anatina]|uniref:Protein crumbs-like n=1 Tax=Lingula anatina TaxID=7574 RepID=A0A1S3HH42_LINAN|nr:protein crumbs-like [Lingula anatina]|eukprot:XP_013385403.1 protein crumbs-like [Lingula anatina]